MAQERAGGPVFCAKWRDPQVKRALGLACVVRDGDPLAKPDGERFGGWVERRGLESSVPAGMLTWRAALRRLDEEASRDLTLPRSLRHSFVSVAREGFSVDAVRAMAGHEDHRTAQGYAHAKPRAGDTARLSERFASNLFAAELSVPATSGKHTLHLDTRERPLPWREDREGGA